MRTADGRRRPEKSSSQWPGVTVNCLGHFEGVLHAPRWPRWASPSRAAGAAPRVGTVRGRLRRTRTLAVDGPRRLEDLSTAAVAADAQLRAEFVTSECIMCNF